MSMQSGFSEGSVGVAEFDGLDSSSHTMGSHQVTPSPAYFDDSPGVAPSWTTRHRSIPIRRLPFPAAPKITRIIRIIK
jgi:hypothetical protein